MFRLNIAKCRPKFKILHVGTSDKERNEIISLNKITFCDNLECENDLGVQTENDLSFEIHILDKI